MTENHAHLASRILLAAALAAPCATAQVAWLRAPDVVAQPGQTVTVAITLDNLVSDLQGWSFSCNIPAPLTIAADAPGVTTAGLNNGQGPDFYAATAYPGQGITTGCVISFFGTSTLAVGGGYELHTCDVTVPANAQIGTVYPITFDGPALGSPPVDTVVVQNGQSIVPTLVAGSITVGAAASVAPLSASSCPTPTMGQLASIDTPRLGEDWTLQVQGLPVTATHALYVLGLNAQTQPMVFFGSPCNLFVSNDVVLFKLAAGGSAQPCPLAIPNAAPLVGAQIFAQGVHDMPPVAPYTGFLGLPVAYYFTNAVVGTLGY